MKYNVLETQLSCRNGIHMAQLKVQEDPESFGYRWIQGLTQCLLDSSQLSLLSSVLAPRVVRGHKPGSRHLCSASIFHWIPVKLHRFIHWLGLLPFLAPTFGYC